MLRDECYHRFMVPGFLQERSQTWRYPVPVVVVVVAVVVGVVVETRDESLEGELSRPCNVTASALTLNLW